MPSGVNVIAVKYFEWSIFLDLKRDNDFFYVLYCNKNFVQFKLKNEIFFLFPGNFEWRLC